MGTMHNALATSDCKMKTDNEAAAYLGVSVSTCRRWRLIGGGPRWVRIGASIRYPLADLEAYVASLPSGGGVPSEAR